MSQLEATGLIPHLTRWAEQSRPLLGICLGLQLLFESSGSPGLGLLPDKPPFLAILRNAFPIWDGRLWTS